MGMEHLPEGAVQVRLSRLERFSPLGRAFWCDKPVTPEMVLAAVKRGALRDSPLPIWSAEYGDAQKHAERVAWFVVHGFSPADHLEIDVGVPSLGCHVREPVQDGNHRLAAALIRGEPSVWCSIAGDCALIRRLFGRSAVTAEAVG